MIFLTIKLEIKGENETRITEDTFKLSKVLVEEIDLAFLEEFVCCAMGVGTSCTFLENVIVSDFPKINEFETDNKNIYPNLLCATHDMLTGFVDNWKIIKYNIKKI
jgi:hypothetical protein